MALKTVIRPIGWEGQETEAGKEMVGSESCTEEGGKLEGMQNTNFLH